jgi:hypothetical protein
MKYQDYLRASSSKKDNASKKSEEKGIKKFFLNIAACLEDRVNSTESINF